MMTREGPTEKVTRREKVDGKLISLGRSGAWGSGEQTDLPKVP